MVQPSLTLAAGSQALTRGLRLEEITHSRLGADLGLKWSDSCPQVRHATRLPSQSVLQLQQLQPAVFPGCGDPGVA